MRAVVEPVTIAEIEAMDAEEKEEYFSKKRKLRRKEREAETAARMAVILARKRQIAIAESAARKQRIAYKRSQGVYWPAGRNMAILQRQVQQESMRRMYGYRSYYGY